MTTPLEQIIRQMIVTHGPMDLGCYMSLCLTHPEYGYYTGHQTVFGREGDFVTAPEISQFFGEIIAFWVADLWAQMEKPSAIALVELGPGRGTLMRDILRILNKIPNLMKSIQVHLVEIGEQRITEQAQSLHGFDITWHEEIEDLPDSLPLIIINNEFFDALPIRQIVSKRSGCYEIVLGLADDGRLCLGRSLADPSFVQAYKISPSEDDQEIVHEISPIRDQISDLIYQRILRQTGAILTFDYGYDYPHGRGTFQAVKNHSYVDVLTEPGHADLTAHVDFNRLKNRALEVGLKVRGPIGQGQFLTDMGIVERAHKITSHLSEEQKENSLAGVKRLIAPDQMGDLFRVLCVFQAGHASLSPAGFR